MLALLLELLLALLLALLAAAAAQEPLFGDGWEEGWGGPARGCEPVQEPDQLSALCTLPAGNVTLSVNRPASWMRITCERNGTFACSQLREASALLAGYVTASRAPALLDSFELKNCALPAEPLRCALALVGREGALLLRLTDARGPLLPVHVEGLRDLEKFRVYYRPGENITRVPYEILSKLPSLRSFSLKKGALVLEPNAGRAPTLPGLSMLELADGALKELPRGAFRNTPALENLLLWGNEIELVDEDAFLGLARVVNVSLNVNRLAALPERALRPCVRLARLDLYGNRLTLLPAPLLRGLRDLREVNVFGNAATLQLESAALADLPSLSHVKLESSSIRALPEDLFRNSTALHHLYLSGNLIESLPPAIFRGLKLRVLVLGNNKLQHLPAEVLSEQDALEKLDLRQNALKQLDEGLLFHTKSLKVLNLGNNELESLDKSVFAALPRLLELNLAGNRLRRLHAASFDGLRALEELSLARNDLALSRSENTLRLVPPELLARYQLDSGAVPPDAAEYHSPLRGLAALRRLDLSRNRVALVCDDWRLLLALQRLDLSHNSLAELSSTDTYFTSGVTVDVRHNRLAHFQPNFYPPPYAPRDIPTFLLDDNPFVCDCRLYQLVAARAAPLATRAQLARAVCAAPPALRGASLAELQPDRLLCAAADCPRGCACVVRPARSLVELECGALPARLPPGLEGFSTRLRLRAAADLRGLPPDVRFVDLSGLNLTEAPPADAGLELDLSGNRLTEFPLELLRRNCTLHLAGNLFDCGCGRREGVALLKRHERLVADYGGVACASGALVSGLEVARLCAARDSTIVGCAVALLGLCAALLTAAGYRYQTEVRILLDKLGLRCCEEAGEAAEDREYDAFVSFAHQDEEYVTRELVPRLEGGRRPLRLCLHYRDWAVGEFIPTQIAHSVERSRRTIVVMSRHFLRSVWAQMEFRAAHGRERLLLLLLEEPAALRAECALDAELRAYFAVNTYVRADDPLVIGRLKDAVLRRQPGLLRARADRPPDKRAGLDVQLNGDGKLVNNALAAPRV